MTTVNLASQRASTLDSLISLRAYRTLAATERRALLVLGDALCIAAALVISLKAVPLIAWWVAPSLVTTEWYWLVTLGAIWLAVAASLGCYNLSYASRPLASARLITAAACLTAVIYFFVPRLSAPITQTRGLMITFTAAMVVGLLLWRVLYAVWLSQPAFRRRALLLVAGSEALGLYQTLKATADADRSEYEFVGYLSVARTVGDEGGHPGEYALAVNTDSAASSETAAPIDQILDVVARHSADEVVVSSHATVSAQLQRALIGLYETGVRISPLPRVYEDLTGRVPVEHIGDDWISALHERASGLTYAVLKRAVDVACAAIGLCVTAIFFPFVALAIRLESSGPIFYRQERLGKLGRPFAIVKFRSMVANAEPDGKAVWASRGDARITRVGRFLRASRLDELPQFWNVLRGDMSLIGPRPERHQFVRELEQQIPFYRGRLLAKPGLSGWAQVNYGYGNSTNDALVKLQYDLYYIKHQSLWLDLVIAIKTIGVILRFKGT